MMHRTFTLSGLGLSLMIATLSAHAAGLTSEHSTFGTTTDGAPIEKYTLRNSHGMQASIITWGGVLQSLIVPDKNGKADDVVLGFDDIQGYQANPTVYFGATIGRFGNRIAGGKFSLDGKQYQVPTNDGPNSLHGGSQGFDKRVWKAEDSKEKGWVGVTLTYVSPDGEMGFPGKLETHVTYSLNEKNELRIQYRATTDKPTVLNLTNHSYFNLAGAGNGDVLKQVATVHASTYTPVNGTLIPTGELAPVASTPMDFRHPTAFGKNIHADHPQLKFAEPKQGGFDFNWVLDTKGNVGKLAAEVRDPQSGRHLQLYTTEPGVQLYTGNFLDGTIKGKAGKIYPHWGAFTLETQHYPDAPNQPDFLSTRLDPGKVYTQTTLFKFSAK
ncbi:aldose epimerase family protein [Pseudomonas sp. 10B1]|uniref:aldose epimerase family protein n=2 Tax=unclassified Pseudomonas TaxID=196821 RepID=UPI002AB37853|nr:MULTISPECIES: aldose epimerase family protein [unclassified Pseudomonas]MDY7560843.1 aldose epimerase family protein [Pseudomonas sp. AB6]MEA9976489.1 aldose epimerase family protein [Pseudomonas sp. RTS4]MEA9996213.1 aldose epimerase family protein [Pseudomonas sp. AA4]MEB0088817.1 aldose epimerase family protein [Pseudomonas sp. RTI1]MEB0128011.1 aldose epimerase family protein [Pseudomonas sp. CCC1.2]